MLLEANFIRHALLAQLGRRLEGRPLLAYVYLTYRCNLRCAYCDDGTGVPYPERESARELTTDEALRLLAILRRETDGVIFTGGEPLMRDDLETVVGGARRMGYKTIALLTNGLEIHRRITLLDDVDWLLVSVDTLDERRGDRLYRRGPGVTRAILDNVDRLAALQRPRGFRLALDVCITPGTLTDVGEVIDFAVERRIAIVPIPVLEGRRAPAGLRTPEYRALVDRLIGLKRRGLPILGTLAYLRSIRDFGEYRCWPSLLVRVRPDGRLLYPCNKINLEGGSLLELGSYRAAMDEAIARHGRHDTCLESCPEGCYMDFSVCIQNPLLVAEEGWQRAKERLVTGLQRLPRGS